MDDEKIINKRVAVGSKPDDANGVVKRPERTIEKKEVTKQSTNGKTKPV